MSELLRRWYGSGPAHLVALTLGGIVGVYAAIKLVQVDPLGVALWVIGGALIHDIVLVPLYVALDRAGWRAAGRPAWWNFVRVPAMLSALLLLVFAPLIFRLPENFDGITGTSVDVYRGRFLAVAAGLFAVSGAAWLLRTALRRSRASSSE